MYVLVRRHVRRDPDISQMKQSFPTSTWTSFHPKAGVEFLADALSFLTKLTCYFQFRYEVVSQRFTMSKQVTLFGAVLEKKPFFAEGTASATSGYYAVIEALWTLDKRPATSGNRKDFLDAAQKQWREVYSINEEACKELFGRAAASKNTSEPALKSFVVKKAAATSTSPDVEIVESVQATECASATDAACGKSSPAQAIQEKNPSVMGFFQWLDVSIHDFFTEDVAAHETVVYKITEVAKKWSIYQREVKLYQSSSTYTWKKSQLAECMTEVQRRSKLLSSSLATAASIRITLSQVLSQAGSLTMHRKMKAIADAIAVLSVFSTHLDYALQRLQSRNAQMRAASSESVKTPSSDIRLFCSTSPHTTWDDTLSVIRDAVDGGCTASLGAPLTPKQLQDAAYLLKEANATPLSSLSAPASVKELHATLQNPVKHEAVKVQMSFIAENCQKLLDLNDRFQSRKPCALKAWDTLHCLQLDLQAFRFLTVEDCTELDEAALDDDHKDVIVERSRKAFVSAEAKVAKYLTTDGQPAADFLKEVRVFDPVATPRMSRNASDYVNIPGFSEVPSIEVRQYFEKFAPEAIAAAITSESGISPDEFWKSVSTNLPQLSALAMRYKDAVTNSADAERSFSMYNLVFSPRRRSLSTENLVVLVFLYHNQGVLYDVFD